MFASELQKYKDNQKLIEVYTDDRDTSKFSVGRVIYSDNDFFILFGVDQYGRFDGHLLMETEAIVRISEDSLYLNKMASLMRYYNEKPEKLHIDQYPVYSLLDHCKQANRIVSVDLLGSGIVDAKGYVEELDFDKCVIRQVSEFGKSDGSAMLLLNDITYITFGSKDEVMLEILNSELFDEMHFN
jgi:hypothetical protein